MIKLGHPLLGNAAEVIDGQLVSVEVRQIVDAIREYSPELQVRWIPPLARTDGQAAYHIMHHAPGHEPYVLMSIRRDEDMTMEILYRIIASDQRNGEHKLSDYDAAVEAKRLVDRQKWLDKLEELGDIAAHIVKSPLNKYTVNEEHTGRVTIRDYGNRIR